MGAARLRRHVEALRGRQQDARRARYVDYLVPDRGASKAYALLFAAMEKTGRVGIGQLEHGEERAAS